MKVIGPLMTLCGDTQKSQLDPASRALPPEITLLGAFSQNHPPGCLLGLFHKITLLPFHKITLLLFHKITLLSLFQCGQAAMFPHLSVF